MRRVFLSKSTYFDSLMDFLEKSSRLALAVGSIVKIEIVVAPNPRIINELDCNYNLKIIVMIMIIIVILIVILILIVMVILVIILIMIIKLEY